MPQQKRVGAGREGQECPPKTPAPASDSSTITFVEEEKPVPGSSTRRESTSSGSQAPVKKKGKTVKLTDDLEQDLASWWHDHPELYDSSKATYHMTDHKNDVMEAKTSALNLTREYIIVGCF